MTVREYLREATLKKEELDVFLDPGQPIWVSRSGISESADTERRILGAQEDRFGVDPMDVEAMPSLSLSKP